MSRTMRKVPKQLCSRRGAICLLIVAVLAGSGLAAWSYRTTGELLRQGEEQLAAREYARGLDDIRRHDPAWATARQR